ncbi:unnamed protein product [Hymenolepis diminuta]|uniref:Plasma membrane ascorbate-dependent reductase CYBRD1 n=1 Tax=Hymenolepis diminuta TaxID=6216 RepID=A0A158QE05_HYMDI|nr:unnamed protein product [Hymenolepis diminuta]
MDSVYQWVIGLITFLVPSIPMRVRAKVLPLHTYMGLFLFSCALIAVISGITEKNLFSNLAYRDLPPPALLSNFMGLSVMIFGGIIFYLVHRYDYRRVEPQNGERVGFRSFN